MACDVSNVRVMVPRTLPHFTHILCQLDDFGLVVQLDPQVGIGTCHAQKIATETTSQIDDQTIAERFEDCGGRDE